MCYLGKELTVSVDINFEIGRWRMGVCIIFLLILYGRIFGKDKYSVLFKTSVLIWVKYLSYLSILNNLSIYVILVLIGVKYLCFLNVCMCVFLQDW